MENNTQNVQINNDNKIDELNALRDLNENKICADCKSIYVEYASITYGIFLCMDCAMNHKSHFKIDESKIKSLNSPYWSQDEILMLRIGGNHNFMNFLKQYDLPDKTTDLKSRYLNIAVDYYRRFVESSAEGIVINEEKPSKEEGILQIVPVNMEKKVIFDEVTNILEKVMIKGEEICDQLQREAKENKLEEKIQSSYIYFKDSVAKGYNTSVNMIKDAINATNQIADEVLQKDNIENKEVIEVKEINDQKSKEIKNEIIIKEIEKL